MFSIRAIQAQFKLLAIISTLAVPFSVSASTIVEMNTSEGVIDIQLYDETAPLTVANFLSYVNSGAYTNSFIHRSLPGFVIQGGGYSWDTVNNNGYFSVQTHAPVVNEFGASNLRGTIAMAKVAGDPNSATSQWFFNLADNSANLDSQNGGFTVFGQVIGNGMQVVDAIAALPRVNAGGDFGNLPLASPLVNGYHADNLVMINNVQVVPVPAAAWLFGTATLAFAGLSRRRNVSVS